ncbi:formate dehydrogenase accessory sulfurtransferase FdhD [Photobacterium halotolerans]|uniref:formate dehydrogenase accessory sulfurtransferase FdhD n=1 Tax=Photobacterium halotolerans TaxID=265726 RepID=UPI003B21AF60
MGSLLTDRHTESIQPLQPGLIQKAVRAKISTLVTLSASTAMTVRWARHNNLNLIHVPHRSAPRLYRGGV